MRKLMLGAALASLLAFAGCTSAQIETDAANIESSIQAGTAALCGIVPTVSSIMSVVGIVTGTTEITTLVGAGVTAVEQDLCSAAPSPASSRFKALPLRAAAPGIIGTTQHGVTVTGWRA